MIDLPPPYPSTLDPSITYPKGAIIGLKVGENKKDAKSAVVPFGWRRIDGVPLEKLQPKSMFNSAHRMVYVMYIRKVA